MINKNNILFYMLLDSKIKDYVKNNLPIPKDDFERGFRKVQIEYESIWKTDDWYKNFNKVIVSICGELVCKPLFEINVNGDYKILIDGIHGEFLLNLPNMWGDNSTGDILSHPKKLETIESMLSNLNRLISEENYESAELLKQDIEKRYNYSFNK